MSRRFVIIKTTFFNYVFQVFIMNFNKLMVYLVFFIKFSSFPTSLFIEREKAFTLKLLRWALITSDDESSPPDNAKATGTSEFR